MQKRHAVTLWIALAGLLAAVIIYLASSAGPTPPSPRGQPSRPGESPGLGLASPASQTRAESGGPQEAPAIPAPPAPQAAPPPAGAKSPPHEEGRQAAIRPPAENKGTRPASPPAEGQGTGEAGASEPAREPAREANAVTVGVAVVGKDGEFLFGPAEVKISPENPWGATALGALEATGLPYALSPRFPDLVEAIAGQRNQGLSGWMYEVNGEVPMVAASRKPVKPGDRVIWWYSQDLSQPPPHWEELADKR